MTSHKSVAILAVPVVAILAWATPGHAAVIQIDEQSPTPLIVHDVTVKTTVYTSSSPWKRCEGTYTSKDPALTFELAKPVAKMRVRVQDHDGNELRSAGEIVVFPDHTYACENNGEVYAATWPAGAYQIFLAESDAEARFDVRIDQPERARQELGAATASVPVVEVAAGMPRNPLFVDASGKTTALAGDAGVGGCVDKRESVVPVATLSLAEDRSNLYLSLGNNDGFVLLGPKGCLKWESYPVHTTLPAGRYTLFAHLRPGQAAKPLVLEIDDQTQPLAFSGDAKTVDVGDLAEPLVLTGKVHASQRSPERDGFCGHNLPRDPDLFIVSHEPIANATLRLVYGLKTQKLRVYGPIEKANLHSASRCTDGGEPQEQKLELLEGTYAVWVVGNGDAVGSDFHVLVTSPKTTIDPLHPIAEPASDASIAARALLHYYPFLDGRRDVRNAPFHIFTEASDNLFVYPRLDLDGPEAPLKGEPLVVVGSVQSRLEVETHEESASPSPRRCSRLRARPRFASWPRRRR